MPRFAARTDPGLRRANNQDSVYAGRYLFAVADGIGGSAAGEVASGVVITALSAIDRETTPDAVRDTLRTGVESAAELMRQSIADDETLEGMGTTLTALMFCGDTVGIAHIGDSRAYLLRAGELVQLTRDDSYVQMLVDEGRISAEEASSHPYRSVVTKAMQAHAPAADYSVRPVLAGDRYLICSDGLSGVVSGETIAMVLSEEPDPQVCVDRLLDLALRAGGPDNITIVVADAVQGGAAPQPVICSVPGFEATGRPGAVPRDTPAAGAADRPVSRHRRSRPVLLVTGLVLVLAVLAGAGWFAWTVLLAR